MILRTAAAMLLAAASTAPAAAVTTESSGADLAAVALELAAGEQPRAASILKVCSARLRAGEISLEEARHIVGICRDAGLIDSPAPAPGGLWGGSRAPDPVEAGEGAVGSAPPPPANAEEVAALLDGEDPPPVGGSGPAPAGASAGDAGEGGETAAAGSDAEGTGDPLPAALQAEVQAVRDPGGDGPTTVVLDKGATDGVAKQQRFRIQRDGETRVLAIAYSVKPDWSVAIVLQNSWAPDVEDRTVEMGDVAVLDE